MFTYSLGVLLTFVVIASINVRLVRAIIHVVNYPCSCVQNSIFPVVQHWIELKRIDEYCSAYLAKQSNTSSLQYVKEEIR